jgi:hypothetical protein
VVVNNGIILIDYSRSLRSRGYRQTRAMLTAGQGRVRPILITAITTALGMLPLAMGTAEYVGRIGAPFAIAVIGGLAAGTLFTLLVAPTVSFGLHNAVTWWRQLGWRAKTAQVVVFALLAAAVWQNIDSILWRLANLTALVLLTPATTYFVKTSLRRTRTRMVAPDEPIRITVRNLVKLYDNHSRFMREWRKPERQRAVTGLQVPSERRRLVDLVWQLPLYAFLFYFAYAYLDGGFWVLPLAVVFYLYSLKLAAPSVTGGSGVHAWRQHMYSVIYWAGPLANGAWLYRVWDSVALVCIVTVLWYAAVLVHATARRLYAEAVDIDRISGRFGRTRRGWYRLVKRVPIIGRQRRPFKALRRFRWRSRTACSGWSAPTARAKPRSCGSSAASCRRPPARWRSTA